jgi:hypothetical protein
MLTRIQSFKKSPYILVSEIIAKIEGKEQKKRKANKLQLIRLSLSWGELRQN